MSEVFEGVVFSSESLGIEALVHGFEPSLVLETATVGDGLMAVYRADARGEAAFSPRMDALGAEISTKTDQAVLVRYDSRTGHRSCILFERGKRRRAFAEADELFVPLGEDGQPMRDRPPLRQDELRPDEEYETSFNAIQVGLAALGRGKWESLFELMTR